jgi:eukaryotic translation initiation factor 2C
MRWPFNVRSFFTDRETVNIGSGIVLWRGYFQSVRPGQGRMYMNIDISTGAMYRPGPLIEVMLDFLGIPTNQPLKLSPARGFPEREHQRVSRFIQGAKILQNGGTSLRSIKKLSKTGANNLRFQMRDGPTLTVAQYFQNTHNRPLRYPDLPCVEVCIYIISASFLLTLWRPAPFWRPDSYRVMHHASRPDHAQASPT